jgi:hypothetical protein
MNHWPFIIAAYAVTAAGTLALLLRSWSAMRRAEAEAERIGRER